MRMRFLCLLVAAGGQARPNSLGLRERAHRRDCLFLPQARCPSPSRGRIILAITLVVGRSRRDGGRGCASQLLMARRRLRLCASPPGHAAPREASRTDCRNLQIDCRPVAHRPAGLSSQRCRRSAWPRRAFLFSHLFLANGSLSAIVLLLGFLPRAGTRTATCWCPPSRPGRRMKF